MRSLPLVFGSLLMLHATACSDKIDGALTIATRGSPDVTFAPNECASGEPLEFFGVDMWDADDRMLRFVHFPVEGPTLIYFDAGAADEAFRIDPARCRRFDGELMRTETSVNGVWAMEGKLALDCDTSEGQVVDGELDFCECADHNNDYSGG